MTHPLLIVAICATSLTALASLIIVMSQGWHGKHTFDHDLEGVQKFHARAVPRVGGNAIVAGIAATIAISKFASGAELLPNAHIASVALLLVAAMPVFIAGTIEDLTKRVSVRARLIASVTSALVASFLLGATVDEVNIWGVDTILNWAPAAVLLTTLVVSGGINAINIIDGFNGLAGTTVVIMLAALGTVGSNVGDSLVVELAVLGLGAAAGFLLINYPTGRLFLGDGGAYLLGFWVAEVAVLLLVRNQDVNAWQVLAICAYPVIEVLYSIYRRRVRKASAGSPDGLHLHSLIYRRVVTRFFSFTTTTHSWKRNAAVTCLVAPCVAVAASLSVVAGTTVRAGVVIVVVQLLTYIAFYRRIVRGCWSGGVQLRPDISAPGSVNQVPGILVCHVDTPVAAPAFANSAGNEPMLRASANHLTARRAAADEKDVQSVVIEARP
jgi:UDP-N-acetylmuramyl pentapeptide phosphotransferase/UDP-N-acetylglucosamine-1-phosphate transferase